MASNSFWIDPFPSRCDDWAQSASVDLGSKRVMPQSLKEQLGDYKKLIEGK
ncbi:hypothetical protein HYU40_00355 [Candidatus Woesearchaeota archaeon]|nr:hypothetical protein [Candidatus Woesearchaeota archaeon]